MSVIQFPGGPAAPEAEDPMIFICRCGCSSFELRSDGTTECCNCGTVSGDADEGGKVGWLKLLPGPDRIVEMPENGVRKVTRIGSADTALKRVLGDANVTDTIAVAVFQADGRVRSWGSEEWYSNIQPEWLERHIDSFRDMLLQPDSPVLRPASANDDEPELDLGVPS